MVELAAYQASSNSPVLSKSPLIKWPTFPHLPRHSNDPHLGLSRASKFPTLNTTSAIKYPLIARPLPLAPNIDRCIRDLKIDVYGKRLTSDTLFAIKTKSLTVKCFTYRIYSKYRKLHTETLCLIIETWRLILNDFLLTQLDV